MLDDDRPDGAGGGAGRRGRSARRCSSRRSQESAPILERSSPTNGRTKTCRPVASYMMQQPGGAGRSVSAQANSGTSPHSPDLAAASVLEDNARAVAEEVPACRSGIECVGMDARSRVTGIGNALSSLARESPCQQVRAYDAREWSDERMKETMVMETPLIGSGSQEEADNRVSILLDLGTSRGYLTYEELNEQAAGRSRLARQARFAADDDRRDGHQAHRRARHRRIHVKQPQASVASPSTDHPPRAKPSTPSAEEITVEDDDEEEIDLNLEEELAEASTKRIDDPVRMYLTQMGEIPLLTREQEIAPGQEDRNHPQDFPLQGAGIRLLPSGGGGDSSAGRRRRSAVRPHDEDQHRRGSGRQGHDRPAHSDEPRVASRRCSTRNRDDWDALRAAQEQAGRQKSCSWRSAAAAAAASSCSKSFRCAPARSRR